MGFWPKFSCPSGGGIFFTKPMPSEVAKPKQLPTHLLTPAFMEGIFMGKWMVIEN
jgi:hypothetical protein